MTQMHEFNQIMSHEIMSVIHRILQSGGSPATLTDIRSEYLDYEERYGITFDFANQFHVQIIIPQEYVLPDLDLKRFARMCFEFEWARYNGQYEKARQWQEQARRELVEHRVNITAREIIERQRAAAVNHQYDIERRILVSNGLKALNQSIKLLIGHLSNEQKEQYKATEKFLVKGCHTGRIYRLDKSPSYNIQCVLTEDRWCFVPAGNLQIGDVLLAQKIALETDEKAALKIANHRPNGGRPPMDEYPRTGAGGSGLRFAR